MVLTCNNCLFVSNNLIKEICNFSEFMASSCLIFPNYGIVLTISSIICDFHQFYYKTAQFVFAIFLKNYLIRVFSKISFILFISFKNFSPNLSNFYFKFIFSNLLLFIYLHIFVLYG